jgi:hypothetical protein
MLLIAQSQSPAPLAPFQKGWGVLVSRVGIHHRALAIEDGEDFIWVWVGAHDEYERLIK